MEEGTVGADKPAAPAQAAAQDKEKDKPVEETEQGRKMRSLMDREVALAKEIALLKGGPSPSLLPSPSLPDLAFASFFSISSLNIKFSSCLNCYF